jgi:hypothetical protein
MTLAAAYPDGSLPQESVYRVGPLIGAIVALPLHEAVPGHTGCPAGGAGTSEQLMPLAMPVTVQLSTGADPARTRLLEKVVMAGGGDGGGVGSATVTVAV